MSKDPNSGYRILRFLSRASVLLNIPGCHSDAQPLSRQWRPFSFYFFIAKKIVCNYEEEPHQQRNTKPTFSASPVETERAHQHVRGRSRKRRRSESSECFQVSDSPPLSSVSAGQRNGTGHQTSRLPWAVFEFCLSGWHEGCWPALFEWPGFC